MDIRPSVEDGGERGLLGLAFDPGFKTNHRLYVYYTRNGGDIVVSRYTTNAARTDVIESTARPLLLIEHSAQANHNGGALAFGPSGNLFIGVGDGGGAGDRANNAQNKNTLLGKILRVNVNGNTAGTYHRYSIPTTNPFRGSRPGRDENWDYGLRNPWRFSFDRATGELFIADVGQSRYEEVDRELGGATGGRNYGWNAMEGMHCFIASKCPKAGDTLPNVETATAGATARSRAGTSTADRPRLPCAACMSSPTGAAAGSGRSRTTGDRSMSRKRCGRTPPSTSRHSARARTASCTLSPGRVIFTESALRRRRSGRVAQFEGVGDTPRACDWRPAAGSARCGPPPPLRRAAPRR